MTPNFERDARQTFKAEGIYDNDPDDAGGETFRGISRVYFPDWSGWALIDEIKKTVTPTVEAMRGALQHHQELEAHAKQFYKSRFWNPLRLDEVVDGRIAEELFDQAVNLGEHRAIVHLQESLNALNRDGLSYNDVLVDGDIGDKTLGALREYFRTEKYPEEAAHMLTMLLNVKQGAYYFECMRKSEIKEKYARGWFKRVRITKEAA
jgi:lysozyme family protein